MASSNRILTALAEHDLALIRDALEPVSLTIGQVLEIPSQTIEHVYFVETALVSIVATTSPIDRIEVAMIGNEGMTGLNVALGGDRSANEALAQASGTALRLPSSVLREAIRDSMTFAAPLQRYAQCFFAQAAQTALANGRGRLDKRLARWLSMWRDRVEDDDIRVTHQFLSILLGVRRPTISMTVTELEGRGLLKATRRHIRIKDRDGLRVAANGFYGVSETECQRLCGKRELWVSPAGGTADL